MTTIKNVARVVMLVLAVSLTTSSYGKSKSKLSYPLVATGQVATYDADGAILENINPSDSLYGQDAHFLSGAKMSYKDNGDGTVTDLNTGLMWQMVPVKQGFSWYGAKEYCETLELAGYDDWRMPSAKELYSISDFSTGWPYINMEYFELINNERIGKDEQYWTSHLYAGVIGNGNTASAFGVNHGTGHIKAYGAGRDGETGGERPQMGEGQGQRPQMGQGQQRPPRDSTMMAQGQGQRPQMEQGQQGGRPQMGQGQQGGGNPSLKYVRAVRGAEYGVNKFSDNGNGTITDKATGLMWAKVDSQEGMDWVTALQYAKDSKLAGYDDWRLPNVKELQGILCYDYSSGATDPEKRRAAIDPIFSCSEFINEKGDKDYPYFWTGTSALFRKGTPYFYAWYVAFGKAVDPSGNDSHGAGAVRFDTKHEGGPAGEDKARFYNYVRLVRATK